jgi:hypothetical protein
MSQSTTFICDRCGQKETDPIIVGRDWRVICRPRLRSDSGVVTLDLCRDCAAFFDVWMKEKRNMSDVTEDRVATVTAKVGGRLEGSSGTGNAGLDGTQDRA